MVSLPAIVNNNNIALEDDRISCLTIVGVVTPPDPALITIGTPNATIVTIIDDDSEL